MNKPDMEYDPSRYWPVLHWDWVGAIGGPLPSALSAKLYSDAICKLCLPGAD